MSHILSNDAKLLQSNGQAGTATVITNHYVSGDGTISYPVGLTFEPSDLMTNTSSWKPTVDSSGNLSWTLTDNTDPPASVNIKGQTGPQGEQGIQGPAGADGQSVTFDITNIASGHRVTLSGAQGSSSFDVMNGDDGVDGVSPTFRFEETEDGVTVIVSGAQGESAFSLYNGTSGNTYSAGPYINIYPVEDQLYISADVSAGTPWISGWKEIGSLSLNFGDSVQIVSSHDFSGYHNHSIGLKGAVVTLPSTAHIGSALDDKLDASAFSSVSGTFLTAHQDVTNLDYVQNSALDYTPSMYISGISGHELYAESANHAFTAETANYVEGGWEYDENNNISSYNGSAFVGQGGGGVDPSALSGYIPKSAAQTDEANVHYNFWRHNAYSEQLKDTVSVYNVVYSAASSFDTTWHNCTIDLANANISTACPILISITSDVTANAISLTACDDGYNPVTEFWYAYPVDDTNLVFSAKLADSTYDYYNSNKHATKLQISQPTGGSDFTISLTGSNNDVLATRNYVDNAVSTAGKTYTGVAPIVVNNSEDKISADCIELSAGNGIDSVKLAQGVIEVSSQGGSNFSTSAFGINPALQVTALTSLKYYDTGVGNSNQLSGNNTNNLGWTMPSAYANVKNDIITDTMPEVSSHYSYLLSYTTPVTGFTSNSGLEIRKYVGNTGTTRKVLSGNSTVGELVPEDYTSRQYLTTNAAGNMQWSNISDLTQIVLVATSGDIPASGSSDNKVYIVTGNS